MKKSICTVLLLVSNQTLAADYIVGGENVGVKDPIRRSIVGIYGPSDDGKSGSICTGSLISKDIALTAAHCIRPGARRPLVVFGRDLKSPETARPVDGVIVNKRWPRRAGRGMDQGDIALVKFPGELPKGYKPVSTEVPEKKLKPGSKVTLAGYGIDDAHRKTGAGRLRKTVVEVAKNRTGKSEIILDQSRGHGACHGDSGGPAFVKVGRSLAVAGVTNRSYPNRAPDDCRHKVVYTKTSKYKRWIASSSKKLAAGKSGYFKTRLDTPRSK